MVGRTVNRFRFRVDTVVVSILLKRLDINCWGERVRVSSSRSHPLCLVHYQCGRLSRRLSVSSSVLTISPRDSTLEPLRPRSVLVSERRNGTGVFSLESSLDFFFFFPEFTTEGVLVHWGIRIHVHLVSFPLYTLHQCLVL